MVYANVFLCVCLHVCVHIMDVFCIVGSVPLYFCLCSALFLILRMNVVYLLSVVSRDPKDNYCHYFFMLT